MGGRCACIVPDGVLFGSSKAHKDIRKELIENQRLEAIVAYERTLCDDIVDIGNHCRNRGRIMKKNRMKSALSALLLRNTLRSLPQPEKVM